MYDIVAQEKNSVTVLRDNNPGLNTPKAGSDTSSFSDNNIPRINNNVKSGISTTNKWYKRLKKTETLHLLYKNRIGE